MTDSFSSPTKESRKILFLTALIAGVILPLFVNGLGAYAVGVAELADGQTGLSVLLGVILDMLGVFSLYLTLGALLFSGLLFGAKESGGIALLGLARILIVYLSAFAVQFLLGSLLGAYDFSVYAAAYFESEMLPGLLTELLLLLASLLIGLFFGRKENRGALKGLFSFSDRRVQALLILLLSVFLVSVALNLSGTHEILAAWESEETALGFPDYLLIAEPYIRVIFRTVCGYFLNIVLLSLLPVEAENE